MPNDYWVLYMEDVFIHHFGQASFNKLIKNGQYTKLFDKNKKQFEKKWDTTWEPHRHREIEISPTREVKTSPTHRETR